MATKLQSNVGVITARMRRKASALVRTTAFVIEGRAKELAAVDTGFMRSSIQTEQTGELSAIVGVGAEYAPHVEFGTVKAAAQPFLGPAFDDAREGFERGLRELV
jgi:HK97 gp10 family phage protein